MPFNSLSFIFFFIFFAAAYFLINNKNKQFLLIAGSWFFYSYNSLFNLIHLLLTTSITYFFAKKIKERVNSQAYLFVGILLIVLQLLFAKYGTSLFPLSIATQDSFWNSIILPIGISFYSLQAISFLADVNSKKYDSDLSLKDVSLFLSFFPQSISGPIHRASELLPQFIFNNKIQINNIVIGLKTMLWGYFCKLIIADKISMITSPIFGTYLEQDGLSLLIASLLFSFQIYFDFWGYSSIAIGVGKILGFNININFNAPYSARSFKEFWHRWHITLSKWMRDYIYIPLGGNTNRKNLLHFCLTILITFLISGFWHGITLTFIFWAIAHAFLYLSETFIGKFSSKFFKNSRGVFMIRMLSIFKPALIFILISFTWLIFRSEDVKEFVTIIKKIGSVSDWSVPNAYTNYFIRANIIYITIIFCSIVIYRKSFLWKQIEYTPNTRREIIVETIFVSFCTSFIFLLGDLGGREFLYFRF
ncbi:MAG: MBOAT family protein [Bacteroidetes bacterium]|nr:MAG: MBOAT family protein [Bacteroidota bacterium]